MGLIRFDDPHRQTTDEERELLKEWYEITFSTRIPPPSYGYRVSEYDLRSDPHWVDVREIPRSAWREGVEFIDFGCRFIESSGHSDRRLCRRFLKKRVR